MRYVFLVIFSVVFVIQTVLVAQTDNKYFTIEVVDAQTNRGVPLVELVTVNDIVHYTDSNGIIAFYEPGLMNKKVFFHIRSHGYEYPKDGFGYQGKTIDVTEGGSIQLRLKRNNIAQRLYRITGQGIYRDSILLKRPVSLKDPVINSRVLGQDTVMMTPYKDKLYWFWGDTNRASYPLGNFSVSGATSSLAEKSLIAKGLNLEYFTNEDGFCKKMCSFSERGLVWVEGALTISNPEGRECLILQYERLQSLQEVSERGLVMFNDTTQMLEKIQSFDVKHPLYPRGHPFIAKQNGNEYYYFSHPHPRPFPNVRVKATWEDLLNQDSYETFTCFAENSIDDETLQVERKDNQIVYGWKKRAQPLSVTLQNELLEKQQITEREKWLQLRDIEKGTLLQMHAGSVYWNSYRQRWILIGQQVHGDSSFLGELWYAEADSILGPWEYARKIVSHNNYTFYNPTQHPFFDDKQGQIIYFEGTYTNTFTRKPISPTPRYNYNQIMYSLDLNDKRLYLPCPVYITQKSELGFRNEIENISEIENIAFFALPPDRAIDNSIPIYQHKTPQGVQLVTKPQNNNMTVSFYGLPLDSSEAETEILYEYQNEQGFIYTTQNIIGTETKLICRVWKCHSIFLEEWRK